LIGLSHAQKLQAILSVCQSNKFTDLAVNSTLLHEILDKIQLSLRNRNLKLAVPNHLFSYYYKMKFVHCGIINRNLDIVLKVPVVAASSNYSVTQATPLNFLWNNNTCNLNFPKSLLITSKSNRTNISEHSSPSCFSSEHSSPSCFSSDFRYLKRFNNPPAITLNCLSTLASHTTVDDLRYEGLVSFTVQIRT